MKQPSADIVVLIPVFNDWQAVAMLIKDLDEAVAELSRERNVRVLMVDDGSLQPADDYLSGLTATNLDRVDILALRRNLGHQRAIAVGLSYIESTIPCQAVVVMDGDGEDSPQQVPLLIEQSAKSGFTKAVFAGRLRRTEKLAFRVFYKLYRGTHILLTGQKVQVGNYSVIPIGLVHRLVVVADLWNHYAAAVYKARLPIEILPLPRGYRYAGESKMNFVSLVIHGLSAMSVYGDRIGVRMFAAATTATAVSLGCLAVILFARLFGYYLPRWMNYGVAILIFALVQLLIISLLFVMMILAGRDSSSFLPVRDYSYFISELREVFRRDGTPALATPVAPAAGTAAVAAS